jgi:hypothetical protein
MEDDESVLFELSRAPTREPMPRKYREVAEPSGGRGHQSVNAMRPKQKTRRHTQSAPTRAMGRECQVRGTEGSRTHYLPDRGTRWCKGQLRFWFKNETRQVPAVGDVLWFCQGCDQVSPGGEEGQAAKCGPGCS